MHQNQDIFKIILLTSLHTGTHYTVCSQTRIHEQQTYKKDDVQYTNTIHSKACLAQKLTLQRLATSISSTSRCAVVACVATPLPELMAQVIIPDENKNRQTMDDFMLLLQLSNRRCMSGVLNDYTRSSEGIRLKISISSSMHMRN